jgi:hypothetical protein
MVTQLLQTQQETMLEMRRALNSLSDRLQQVENTKATVDTTMLTTIKETFQESMREMERATIERFGPQVPQMVMSRTRNNNQQEDDASSFTSHLSGASKHNQPPIRQRRQVDPEPSLSSTDSRSHGRSSKDTSSTVSAPDPPEEYHNPPTFKSTKTMNENSNMAASPPTLIVPEETEQKVSSPQLPTPKLEQHVTPPPLTPKTTTTAPPPAKEMKLHLQHFSKALGYANWKQNCFLEISLNDTYSTIIIESSTGQLSINPNLARKQSKKLYSITHKALGTHLKRYSMA